MANGNRYQNFTDLSAQERENFDYRIEMDNRFSPITVFAIHGGRIEHGTSVIARAIAGADLNLYLFEGLKESGNFKDLHISSTQFDEPQALELAATSRVCITIHGFKERQKMWVAMGGLNAKVRTKIFDELLKTGLLEQEEQDPIGRLPGIDPFNIVNRCIEGGVQIEISARLRRLLAMFPQHLLKFSEAVRNGIANI